MVGPKKKRVHYVNNKTLYEEMVKFRQALKDADAAGKPKPQIPKYIGECFIMICNKLSTKPNFINYSYRDDMIADGIENCVSAVAGFDPSKSTNPFAYFTQIAWNAFIRRITKEKKQAYIKHKNFEHNHMLDDLNEEIRMTGTKLHNEYSAELIRNFENKLVKVEKKTKVGLGKFVEDTENDVNKEPAHDSN